MDGKTDFIPMDEAGHRIHKRHNMLAATIISERIVSCIIAILYIKKKSIKFPVYYLDMVFFFSFL